MDAADSFDYIGLPAQAGQTAASPENSNVAVVVEYEANTSNPTRLENGRIRVIGLNPRDHSRIAIGAELTDGASRPLLVLNESGSGRVALKKPFRRLVLEVTGADGRILGRGEIPFTTKSSEAAIASSPLSATTLFSTELITGDSPRDLVATGLASLEGPYPQWDLPRFRWVKQPEVRLTIPANSRLRRIRLSFSARLQVRSAANLEVLHNGKVMQDFRLEGATNWSTQVVEVPASSGENVLVLRDQHTASVPDWLAYLEQNPDVKEYVLSQKNLSPEEGARLHYESNGRAERRALPMHANPAPPPVPTDSLYFVYRSLRVEGLTEP